MVDSMPTQPLFDLWKKGLEDSTQAWARLLTQSPAAPPDPTAFWKPVVEQWVQAWARTIAAAAPVKKVADQQIESALQTLNMASRTQVTAVARQIVELEERIERVEDAVGAVSRKLDDVLRAVQKRPAGGGHEVSSKER